MKAECPQCGSPRLCEGGCYDGPKWVEFSCGSVWHQEDEALVEHMQCLRRQNARLHAKNARQKAQIRVAEQAAGDKKRQLKYVKQRQWADTRRAKILQAFMDSRPTPDEFRFHYECEWDTTALLGWDEILICCEQLGMTRQAIETESET